MRDGTVSHDSFMNPVPRLVFLIRVEHADGSVAQRAEEVRHHALPTMSHDDRDPIDPFLSVETELEVVEERGGRHREIVHHQKQSHLTVIGDDVVNQRGVVGKHLPGYRPGNPERDETALFVKMKVGGHRDLSFELIVWGS